MAKHVHICGLYRADLRGYTQSDLSSNGEQIWTLNDWYQFYPWMMPDRVLNVHYFPHINESEHRFTGDWKAQYNRVVREGGKISVVEVIKGVCEDGQELLPMELRDKFAMSSIGCGVSTAINLAIHLGFKKISLHSIRLRDAEYAHQIQFIQNALKNAEIHDVEVDNPYHDDWSSRISIQIDWVKNLNSPVGSLPHLVKYFIGDELSNKRVD